MAFNSSLIDKLSYAVSPVIRKLKDINTKLLGTKTKVIRIKQTEINLLGDISYEYQTSLLDNVIIQYPFNQVEIFSTKDNASEHSKGGSLDFFDLLPINMYTYYEKSYISGASELDENDLIVDVLWDEHGNGIPIIMQISRIYSSFYVKNSISKKFELTLRRGDLESDIQDIIDSYISGISLTSGSA